MNNYRIKVHPLFLLLGVFYVIIGSGWLFCAYFLSLLLHEMAHARMAKLRGYQLGHIVLMPYGAVLKGGEDFPRVDSVLIAIAGPMVNLMLALLIIALWWLVPDLYSYTEDLMWANLSLALFNLIPVFPLDGARVILALSKGKAKTLRRLRIVGIVMSVLLVIMMLISSFFSFNISLGIMALFLMHGAISGTDNELYHHVMSMDNFNKSTVDVLLYLDIGINYRSELFRFLECVKPSEVKTFHVLDDERHELCTLGEGEVMELLLRYDMSTRFIDIMDEVPSIGRVGSVSREEEQAKTN